MSLQVEISGSGPDLVLIHGWGMHSGIWGGVIRDLALRYRVHAVDLPGYGASPACQPYDLDALARSVADVAPNRAAVIGWSLGGLVAQRWALEQPDQVKRLMLVGSTPCFVQRPDWPHGVAAEVLQNFARELERDYAATLLRFLSLQARNGEHVRSVMKYLRVALFARGVPAVDVLAAGLGILLDSDLRRSASALSVPLYVLHGERDALAPADAARWLAGTCGDAVLNVIPGCAHAPFLSHPETFLRAVTEFFGD